MSITLTREPTREDFEAARHFMGEDCTCDSAVTSLGTSEYLEQEAELDSMRCKPCRVRKRWNELLKVIDEG